MKSVHPHKESSHGSAVGKGSLDEEVLKAEVDVGDEKAAGAAAPAATTAGATATAAASAGAAAAVAVDASVPWYLPIVQFPEWQTEQR